MSMDSDGGWSNTSSDSVSDGVDGDSTTEHVGFFQRLMQSLVGILIGLDWLQPRSGAFSGTRAEPSAPPARSMRGLR